MVKYSPVLQDVIILFVKMLVVSGLDGVLKGWVNTSF